MARIRTIKPEFWDDLKIAKLSRDARLLYIGLWNFADDLGVVIGDHLWIKSRIYPFDQVQMQQFEKWLKELISLGFISLFSHQGEEFYYLPNLLKHQVINRPNMKNVNVSKDELHVIVESLNNHGSITDSSHSGREGKGKDKEKKEIPSDEGKKKETSVSSHPPTDYDNFCSWLAKNAPYCATKIEHQITQDEFHSLRKEYTNKQLADTILKIENRKDLRKKYVNLYLTVKNWLEKEYPNNAKQEPLTYTIPD